MFRRFCAMFFCLMLFLLSVCLHVPAVEVPDELAFQGRLLDIGGVPVPEGSKEMQFSIFDVDTGGTALWDQTYDVPIGKDGFYTVYLGAIDPTAVPFDEAYWVEVRVESDLPMVPRFPLKKVAYAFRADEADCLEGHPASGFAPSAHTHLGQDWSGSDQYGLTLTTSHTSGAAISGNASAATGTNYGGYFTSASADGRAVYGLAATGYGGYFQSDGAGGTGVYGYATEGTSGTTGGYFQSDSTSGTGVSGYAAAETGSTYGGFFTADSPGGVGVHSEAPFTGVRGVSTVSDDFGYGGFFQSNGIFGTGVRGVAISSSGTTYGGLFQSNSTSGTGISGYAAAEVGGTYGGFFTADSTSGIGAHGEAPYTGVKGAATAASGSTYGGLFQSNSTSGIGVSGHAPSETGSTCGGLFTADSTEGVGVHGEGPCTGVKGTATATSGPTYGGYFESSSTSGTAIYGFASAATGATYGGYFEQQGIGGAAVYGRASATSGNTTGGHFWNDSTSGHAIAAWADATSGDTTGIFARVNSDAGYAGWFSGGHGILVSGNIHADGDIGASGVKTFIEPHPHDATKEIVYAAIEGPEAATYIRGTAEFIDGEAIITLPEHFGLVTSSEGLTVSLTPLGEWLQLYVTDMSPEQLIVLEASGKGGRFCYLVQGVRKGYEDFQVVRDRRPGREYEPEASLPRPEPIAPYATEKGDENVER